MSYAEKPWLKSYKLGPYKLEQSLAPFPKEPLFKVLDDAAEKYPTQTAVHFLGRTIKYSLLKRQVDRLSAALAGLGVEKGDTACLFLPNCIEFILGDWAIMKAGAAVVPTSILRTDEGIIHEVGSSKSKLVFCQESSLDRILAVRDSCDFEHIIVTSDEGYDVKEVSRSLPKGVYEIRALLEQYDPQPPEVDIDPEEDLCELAFTGGATGLPKGVMITHFNRYSCILQGFPWLLKPVVKGLAGKASVMIPIPMFHSYGHYAHQAGAHLGLRVIILPEPRDIDAMVDHIREFRPLFISAVPTQLIRIAQADLGRLNTLLLSGSAPLPLEVAEEIHEKTGARITEAYGLTETSPLTHFNVSAFSRITGFMQEDKHGIGVPSPDTECKLVELDTGEEVPFGSPGEIVVRGPQVMKGYWPEAGSGLTEDGWLHTGDIAVMDEDGYFTVVDRMKDMVNVSGMKVYTSKVDEVLFQHPGVLMAAAFGVPDPELLGSERVMAVIQLKDGYQGKVNEDDIRSFCREHLAPYAVPKFVRIKDELPLTVTEKVFKKVLRDEAVAEMKERGEIK
jgi:long-chain acyl-CoA synthetase